MASSGAREPVEDPASKVLITSRVADQFPNTIPVSRLMQRWRWITAGSQFPRGVIREIALVDTIQIVRPSVVQVRLHGLVAPRHGHLRGLIQAQFSGGPSKSDFSDG